MNGPQHYAEAERLLALALKHQENGLVPRAVEICNTQAQVHATLALAAATVATRVVGPQEPWGGQIFDITDNLWREVRT